MGPGHRVGFNHDVRKQLLSAKRRNTSEIKVVGKKGKSKQGDPSKRQALLNTRGRGSGSIPVLIITVKVPM